MFTLFDTQQIETNIFDCISVKMEDDVPVKTTGVIDYMVTVFPREEKINGFQFVYGLFDTHATAFSKNQQLVLNIANDMFSDSLPLDQFEQKVLNTTFKRVVKTIPTLPGRK